MWRQSANHSHSLRWEQKTTPWEFQTKLLHYFFLSNNKSNLHFAVGSIAKKRGLYRGDSLVPIYQLPVPGRKLWIGTTATFFVYQSIIFELDVFLQPWCDSLFETRGATHCFLQHMLVRPIEFYNTSNSIKTRLIKWKQWPGIQSWISKLCFLISMNY